MSFLGCSKRLKVPISETMTMAATANLGQDDTLGTLNIHAPSVAFYGRRLFRRYNASLAEPVSLLPLCKRFEGPRRVLVIARVRHLRILTRAPSMYVWAMQYGYALVGNQPPPEGFGLPPIPWTEADMSRKEQPTG